MSTMCPYSDISQESWADAYDDALMRLPEGVEPTDEDVLARLDERARAGNDDGDCLRKAAQEDAAFGRAYA